MRGVRGLFGNGVRARVASRRLRRAALRAADEWGWPLVPGVRLARDGSCTCGRADCPVPGAHPGDPTLLAASSDPRMVGWWWQGRPQAPVLLATGRQVNAVSLPAPSGERLLEYFDALHVPTGPVLSTGTRYVLLVAPYTLPELGELLVAQEWVPTSLRYHGSGGFVPLPPSRTRAGQVRWVRAPGRGAPPWLPEVGDLVEALVAASAACPDGARLSY